MSQLPVFVNGQAMTEISYLDRGFNYGDGLFETIRVNHGVPVLWSLHLDRLLSGCNRLGIALSTDQVQFTLDQLMAAALAAGFSSGIAKLVITRGVGGRGYTPEMTAQPSIVSSWHAIPQPAMSRYSDGISLLLCESPLSRNPLLAGIKHMARLEQVLAAREVAQSGADDGLLVDVDGYIIEALAANIFFQQGAVLHTPCLNQAGVAGTLRRYLMDTVAPELSVPVVEREIHYSELANFDHAFISSSVFGLTPVSSIGDRPMSDSVLMRQLQTVINEVVCE
ncbi:MAG: aminodeoxychorismate lyase [Pseudomonadales bacterium]